MQRLLTISVCMGILGFPIAGSWAQARQPLDQRIAKPDPRKYRSIRRASDWKNPILVVQSDGIRIVGITDSAHPLPLDEVDAALNRLPDTAWPYGLAVVVQQNGLRVAGDDARIDANWNALLSHLWKLHVQAELWPSG